MVDEDGVAVDDQQRILYALAAAAARPTRSSSTAI